VWRRRGEAAIAGLSAALYSAHHDLYSEAVVSSVASAVALVDVGRFREAVEYVQRAAKALYEAAKDVFEHVKITVQRLVELFVEAVVRVLAWVDEHKAYLFLMAAGVVALSAALNLWGLVELEKLAYAASLTPFVAAGVKEYSREEAFRILREASDPYKEFKEIAKAANAGRVKLAEPWESLRVLIMPKPSEERKLMWGGGVTLYSKYREDENYKRALLYATLALEEAFGVYRSALGEYAAKKVVQRVEVVEEPFKRVMYMPDLGLLTQLAEKEEAAFEDALRILRVRLNEYAVKYNLRDLLDVNEDVARRLAEAMTPELPELNDVSFGTKAYAALVAYREYELGRRGVFGTAARYWLEEGGSARLLYYTPYTAYRNAKKERKEGPAAVEELVAEALRRLFLKPGADCYRGFVEELTRGGRLTLELEEEKTRSHVFKLYRLEEGGGLKELGVKLRITKVGEGASIVYALGFEDVKRWREFFKQELEAAVKAAEEVKGRLPVKDRLPYMLGWVNSDVAISRRRNERVLQISTSHLWQLAETQALFDWSNVAVDSVSLTLEGPKPKFYAYAPLDSLDEAIRRSAEGGWLYMLGTKAGLEDLMHVKSWDGLKRWVADHWNEVIDAVKRRLKDVKVGSGFDLTRALEELKRLKSRLDDDKIAREVVAPVLLLIQADRLGVSEETLRYFGAVASGAIDGDGHVSAARREVGLASGEREVALLWAAALAAYGIKTKIGKGRGHYRVNAFGDDAARLAGLYFLYGTPLLEGDERIINYKRYEAMKLAAEGLNIRWERLREIKGGAAADLIISEGDTAVKYNVYLRNEIVLEFSSADWSHVELAARLLRLAGVSAEVKKKSGRDAWRIEVTTDMLAAGREELRKAIAEIVEKARKSVGEEKAERWLKKLESGRVLMEGWPKYGVRLTSDGALVVEYRSTNPDSIKQVEQQLKQMGLEKDVHFTVKMPEEGREGYVYIRREGLAYAAWLSVHGEDEDQRELAAEFVELILQRAKEACGGAEPCAVYEKAKEIVEKGRERDSLTLKDFKKEVEVDGKTYVVKVIGWSVEPEESRSGKPLLRIRIKAEVGRVEGEHIVDPVVREYTITYSRRGAVNKAVGYAVARADAPGGRETDAERLAAVIEALTGVKPRIRRMKDGAIIIECGREHHDGFMRYKELADVIMKWLKETSR